MCQVLMATGRKPKTKGIGLEDIGVELDEKGSIKVRLHGLSTLPRVSHARHRPPDLACATCGSALQRSQKACNKTAPDAPCRVAASFGMQVLMHAWNSLISTS
jgi:hypothetical protein